MILGTLSELLLFLADGKSGYDIRLLFQATPIGLFSDSPGAVYPALAKLEQAGLLKGEPQPSGRRRRVYRRTEAGEDALLTWLKAPVDPRTVARRPHELELRYVLIAFRLGKEEASRYLGETARAFEHRIAELTAFRDANADMGAPSLDALDLGIRLFRTRLSWCRDIQRKGEKEI